MIRRVPRAYVTPECPGSPEARHHLVPPGGIEPPTHGLGNGVGVLCRHGMGRRGPHWTGRRVRVLRGREKLLARPSEPSAVRHLSPKALCHFGLGTLARCTAEQLALATLVLELGFLLRDGREDNMTM